MRILVAGGAGFIGSEFVRSLLAGSLPDLSCDSVTVLDALTYAGLIENLASASQDPRYEFVHGDINDRTLLDRVIPGHDLVVNFAAESHVDRSIAGPRPFVRTNIEGASCLMDACQRLGTPRMLQVSTDEVYGSVDSGTSVETDALLPNSPYAASKASADLLARSYHQTFGLDIVVTRCTNNYGPYQFPEKLIPLFITNLMTGRKLPLYGDGKNVREWVHVADHCKGIALAALNGEAGEIYNVGGGSAYSNLEITQLLLDHFGASWTESVDYVPDRLGHDRRYALNDDKIRSLGYVPEVSFEAGLNQTIGWYLANVDWWEPLLSRAMRESLDEGR